MRYQRVRWNQPDPDCPTLLYSEIDGDGWETRKVEEYISGQRDLATLNEGTGSTFVSSERIPPLEDINSSAEFDAVAIEADDFESVWLAAKEVHRLP